MNLLRQLFKRHGRTQDSADRRSYDWPGQSGKKYEFQIYPLNASLKALPGVYIYARQLLDGDWDPVYIAQTRDLHQRLEGHVKMDDAVANGATHLHAHYCNAGQAARCTEEHDLVQRWQPICNDRLES